MSQESDGMPSAKRRKEAPRSSQSYLASQSSQGEAVDYRKGSIIRLTMKDFVTYSQAEIRPGAQLNVVIGPNGTGKSTLVCAMVLGLGGKPAVLGRAKEPRDFIKHGEETAIIETELYGGPGSAHNYIIRRKIFNDNTSTWKLNGRDSSQKEVLAFVKKLNVQVENLCQFLPQDRVSSFAAMDPMQLLHETQMAINDELAEQHKELIQLKKEEIESRTSYDTQARLLDELKKVNEGLRRDVMRFQERARLVAKLEALESKRPWVAFEASRLNALALQEAFKQAEAVLKEAEAHLAPLEEDAKEKAAAVDAGNAEEASFNTKVRTLTTQRAQLIEKLKGLADKTAAAEAKLTQLEATEDRRKATVQRLTKQLEDLRASIEKAEEMETERVASMKRLQADLEKAKAAEKAALQDATSAGQGIQPLETKKQGLMSRLKETEAHRKDMLALLAKEAAGSLEVYKNFVAPNAPERHRLQGALFGPLFLEIQCSNPLHCEFLERAINFAQWTGYVAENDEDRDLIVKWCAQRRIQQPWIVYSARALKDSFRHPLKPTELKDLALDGWLSDLIEAPPLVRWTLCNIVFLHSMPYCNTDAADAHFDKIKMLTTSETNAVKRWFTRSNHFTSKSSMYSDTITVDVAALNDKPAKFCKPSQPNLAYELQAQLEAMDAELAGLRATADTAKRAHNACKTETQRITTEISKLKHSDIQSLKARAKDIQSQITEHDTDPEEARQNFTRSIAATVKSRVAPLLALRDISPQWIEANVELAAMLLKRGLLKSRAEAATATYREAREASAQLRQRLAAAKAEFEQAKEQTKTLRNEAKRRADKTPELEAQWAELPDTLEELDDQIDNHRVRIQAISPNPAIMEKYTAREEEIHKLEESLANHDANLKEKQARIDELRDSWLPEIESFIDAIDQNFSEYFKQIGCVGNIRLAKDGDDFASYGIDIWVSYRATDAPKKLDARVQSGGERSVATMLYLIALQELSDCPFRLVDEINQGMDPHNERMIFDRVTAQASKHNTPQYFLITPKLLPDLKFTPAITVLCVFNGPYMVDQDKWAVTV